MQCLRLMPGWHLAWGGVTPFAVLGTEQHVCLTHSALALPILQGSSQASWRDKSLLSSPCSSWGGQQSPACLVLKLCALAPLAH